MGTHRALRKKNLDGRWIPYRDLPPDEQKKHRARALFNSYFYRSGAKRPRRCWADSRGGKIEFHHTDYDKPFLVVALCTRCHLRADLGRLDVAALVVDMAPVLGYGNGGGAME